MFGDELCEWDVLCANFLCKLFREGGFSGSRCSCDDYCPASRTAESCHLFNCGLGLFAQVFANPFFDQSVKLGVLEDLYVFHAFGCEEVHDEALEPLFFWVNVQQVPFKHSHYSRAYPSKVLGVRFEQSNARQGLCGT